MQMCECSVCRMKTLSIPETRHRRCGGGFTTETVDEKEVIIPKQLREKHKKLPSANRGTWH